MPYAFQFRLLQEDQLKKSQSGGAFLLLLIDLLPLEALSMVRLLQILGE